MLCNESDVHPLELLIVNFSSEVIELGTCMWVIIEKGANELINFAQRMELYKIPFSYYVCHRQPYCCYRILR